VWLFVVGSPKLSESDARTIIRTYDDKYPAARVLNIEIFCDEKYAAYRFVDDPSISDRERAAHILYSFMRSDGSRYFYTPMNPEVPGQGSACR
jgi:hypothetical protein